MNLGFSYIGLVYLLMLFIPNIMFMKNIPSDYNNISESRILAFFEKLGQALITVSLLIFENINFKEISYIYIFLFISFVLMILYELCWTRYFRNNKKFEYFYKSFIKIPIPLATLPPLAFLFLGIYGFNIIIIISTIIFGIGHIGIHLNHFKNKNNFK